MRGFSGVLRRKSEGFDHKGHMGNRLRESKILDAVWWYGITPVTERDCLEEDEEGGRECDAVDIQGLNLSTRTRPKY